MKGAKVKAPPKRFRSRRLMAGMMTALAGSGLLTGPAAAAEGVGADGLPLVPLDEIAVPILDGARLEGVLRFTVVLRAHDAQAAIGITRQIARLRSTALVAGLDFARLRASPYRAIDVEMLTRSLNAALKAADPGVEQALVVRVGAATR